MSNVNYPVYIICQLKAQHLGGWIMSVCVCDVSVCVCVCESAPFKDPCCVGQLRDNNHTAF